MKEILVTLILLEWYHVTTGHCNPCHQWTECHISRLSTLSWKQLPFNIEVMVSF